MCIPMTEPLHISVGTFIHSCGALELLTNNAIRAFATDSLLSAQSTKMPWARRIVLLRQLLLERTELEESTVKDLCQELDSIRKERNIVAHNPVALTENGYEVILVLQYGTDGNSNNDTRTLADIQALVKRAVQLLGIFAATIPSATKQT